MEREQVVKIVDEVVEGLLEGGPGSGRYPDGSGKNPDAKSEHPKEYETMKGNYLEDKHRDHMKSASTHADIQSKKAERGGLPHSVAREEHKTAGKVARKYGATKLSEYHEKKEKYHKTKEGK